MAVAARNTKSETKLADELAKRLSRPAASSQHYSVSLAVAIGSANRDYAGYGAHSAGTLIMTPIPLLFFMRLTNLQEEEAQLTALLFTIYDKDRKRSVKARVIEPELETYSVREGQMFRIEFSSQLLELAVKPLGACRYYDGWVLLDVPQQYNSLVRPRSYEVVVEDSLGNRDVLSMGTEDALDTNIDYVRKSYTVISGPTPFPKEWKIEHLIEYESRIKKQQQ